MKKGFFLALRFVRCPNDAKAAPAQPTMLRSAHPAPLSHARPATLDQRSHRFKMQRMKAVQPRRYII
jgi:hypothetical protein